MEPEEKPITALLFDYGGVLAEEGFHKGLAEIARRQGLDPRRLPEAGMDAIYDSGYVTGRGTEAEFWRLLKARTGLEGDEARLREEILQRFRLRPEMLALVDELRSRGFRVAILSDQTDWLDRLEARDRFFHHFHRVFNSHHLGMGKRNPRIFRVVACRMGVEPGEVLFVDDSPGNVERTRRAGMRALRFENPEALREALDRLLPRWSPAAV